MALIACRYLTPLAAFLWWHGFTDDFYRLQPGVGPLVPKLFDKCSQFLNIRYMLVQPAVVSRDFTLDIFSKAISL